jgi:hypothetical protein
LEDNHLFSGSDFGLLRRIQIFEEGRSVCDPSCKNSHGEQATTNPAQTGQGKWLEGTHGQEGGG